MMNEKSEDEAWLPHGHADRLVLRLEAPKSTYQIM